MRPTALKLPGRECGWPRSRPRGAFQGGDGATAGALGSTAQKVAAVCGAGAPRPLHLPCDRRSSVPASEVSVPITAESRTPRDADAIEKTVVEEPAPVVSAPPEAESEPPGAAAAKSQQPADEAESTPAKHAARRSEPRPSEPASEEFGFESSAPPAVEAAPAPEPAGTAPNHLSPKRSIGWRRWGRGRRVLRLRRLSAVSVGRQSVCGAPTRRRDPFMDRLISRPELLQLS